ncbi:MULTISPECIES: hypothetical protein [unclassified Streptomyces]|uniref:hypothetical protein n=1 Tax=unclassified Streptomyces TaxID=2593676 RepID=UPI003BB4B1FA
MNVRPDVAELLRAGLSNRAIARELNVDADTTVRNARTALGIAKARRGKRAASSVEDLFWRRTQPVDDGHILWTGYRDKHCDTALVRHGGKLHTALRVAFRIKHGREPEGHVTLTCDRDGCVAPGHTQDRLIRSRTEATFAAIFGRNS